MYTHALFTHVDMFLHKCIYLYASLATVVIECFIQVMMVKLLSVWLLSISLQDLGSNASCNGRQTLR